MGFDELFFGVLLDYKRAGNPAGKIPSSACGNELQTGEERRERVILHGLKRFRRYLRTVRGGNNNR